jgi:hypothetical protein
VKSILIISFLLLAELNGFGQDSKQFKNVKKDSFYFPIKTELVKGDVNAKLDTFMNKWYSEFLYSLKEPILMTLNSKKIEVYRYTNLGTWSNPYSYRVEKKDSLIKITKKRTNGQGGYECGRLVEDKTKNINAKVWEELINRIESIDFWKLNTHGERGLDGSEWILEGYKDGKYHFISRWSPDSYGDKKIVETCLTFEEIFNQK